MKTIEYICGISVHLFKLKIIIQNYSKFDFCISCWHYFSTSNELRMKFHHTCIKYQLVFTQINSDHPLDIKKKIGQVIWIFDVKLNLIIIIFIFLWFWHELLQLSGRKKCRFSTGGEPASSVCRKVALPVKLQEHHNLRFRLLSIWRLLHIHTFLSQSNWN